MNPEKRVRETLALKHVHSFVKRVKRLIEGIELEDLLDKGGLNPYMIAALGINSIEEAVELFVYRRVERSLGTSFGNVIEAFLRDVLGGKSGRDLDPNCKTRKRGAEKPWVCWWDIIIPRTHEKGGKRYKGIVISVKSGPADINKDIVERFIQHAKEAEEYGYKPYLALTYGKQAFTVAKSTLRAWGLEPQEYLLVGRDIFKEFLGDPDYYEHVIDLMKSAAEEIDIFDLMNKKIKELTGELKRLYGNDIIKLLKDLS
ncbi:MAG: hypothetical protein F7C35_03765 [Desulfurococcales archaeon]|nr:hypothetical protein [Desulfurococcales archaeon]